MAGQTDVLQNHVLSFLTPPKFISVVPITFHEGVKYEPHVHEYTEIMLITDGRGIQSVNGIEYHVKTGDLVLLNQHCIHAESTEKDNPVSLITCKMDNIRLNTLGAGQVVSNQIVPVIESGSMFEKIHELYKEMYYEKSFMDACSPEILELDTKLLLYYVYRLLQTAPRMETQDKRIDNIVDEVRQYIDQHYTEDISLESLSSEFYISVSFLVHAFKRETGKSPINYLIDRRMGEAQRYLSFSDMPVAEISERVGYENVSYFNKVFLKRTGFQPSLFRELYSLKKHMEDVEPEK